MAMMGGVFMISSFTPTVAFLTTLLCPKSHNMAG
jgi:hypothetical protein